MISKKNNALIFDPKFTLPFKKHEMFGGVVHVSHVARKLTFIGQRAGFFLHTLRRSKGCDFFMTKIFTNFCLTC